MALKFVGVRRYHALISLLLLMLITHGQILWAYSAPKKGTRLHKPTSISSTFIKPFEFSVAGGPSWLLTQNTTLTISPYETDSNQVSNVNSYASWKVGIGYFLLEPQLKKQLLLDHLLLETNVYYTAATVKGSVWQYQYQEFNNYNFTQPMSSTRLMLDLKPYLFTYKSLSPYLIGGVGVSWNVASYRETVTGVIVKSGVQHQAAFLSG